MSGKVSKRYLESEDCAKRSHGVPCKLLAEELGLKIHQRGTFTKWELPERTNLIIAVSFGLFVPPRILRAAKYGGLNVHPSLLPDLRGPAPIHHAILQGYQHTGVSLQTLDDKAFDHGTVLVQSPFPGISIPSDSTVQELTKLLAPIGAQMLVRGLRDGVHVQPRREVGWKAEELDGKPLAHAPKVKKADGQVDWTKWRVEDVMRRIQVLGSVWTHAVNKKGHVRRLIILDAEMASVENATHNGVEASFIQKMVEDRANSTHERPTVFCDDGSCLLQLANGEWIKVRRVKEEELAQERLFLTQDKAAAEVQKIIQKGCDIGVGSVQYESDGAYIWSLDGTIDDERNYCTTIYSPAKVSCVSSLNSTEG
ncbi:Fc.00g098670.m01.CDS01 [Cosmosporella sp. VM-42]